MDTVWPGFGENMRILEWIVNRAKGGKAMGIESPIGWMPRYKDITWEGIEGFSKAVTYSHMGNPTLPSAMYHFTAEFGMGSGGSNTLMPPGKLAG